MNKKLSAVLCGIASLVIAGFISFIPAFTSQAAPVSFTSDPNESMWVEDYHTGFDNWITGNVTWTLYNIDLTTDPVDYCYVEVEFYDDGTAWFDAEIFFDHDYSDESAYGYASYDFRYNGMDFNGVIVLTYCCGDDLCGETYGNVSDFANTGAGAVKGFYKSIKAKVNEINLAAQGLNADGSANPEKTVEYKYNYAINYTIIQAVANAKDVTLLYTFEYEGHIFQSTITSERAAEVFTLDIPWYGPCYIASNFPTVYLGEAA